MSASEAAREAAVVEGFPLSAQQAHLWSLGAGRAGGGSVFRAEGEISIRSLDGTLDARRITAALSAVVASTEILRTELRTVPGMSQPLQIVGGEPFAWRFERDLSGLSEAARIEALASVRADLDAAAPAGSPLDAALVRLAPESWLVRLRLPASAADGATLASLVTALGRSLAHLPAAEPFQYADYAAWQLDLAGSPETESARAFWRRQDLPALPPLRLPFERARAAAAPFAPAAFGFELALPEAALTPSFLLAAWQVLAARLSGVADLAVGVLCEGREFAELAGALGCFAEHLPVVARLAESDRFEQVARRAARALDQARASAVGFAWERLAEWTGAAGPMYPELAFEHAGERERFAASGVEIELLTSRVIGERFGLALAVARAGPGRAAAEIRYDAARFERADAVRVAGWLGALLADAAARPGAAIADLEILTAGERAESARAVRAGRIELPAACLHALVAARGARSPGRIAIEAEEGTLTYAELAAGARRLARRLAGLGVRAGEPVALLAERSLDLIVGMLGILEAGAAYVPLDPDHPFERRAGILDEIEPRAVVAQGGLAATLPAGGFALVAIDGMGEGPEADPQPAALDDLAYLIYTSGSTGRPKGVMVSHRAIANRLLWMERAFPLAPSDRVLHKTPASFDASIWEIFCPLVAGATLVLARPGGHQDSGYLAELAASAGITRLQLVPSQLAPFLDEPACALSTALADVFCGGEELPAALADRLAARLPARLHNLYGPTEAAIDATCRPRVAPGLARVPIGRPIANVAIHLVNSRGVPVPDGVAGEIAIGGAGLARGYFARPAATALGFVPDPFSGQAGARLYRTGDLARRTPESEIEYLGRIDRQVKVRGMRIELGEIEAVLAEVPGVARAIAAARPEAGGAGIRLVAWVVAAGGEPAPDLAALRERLRERLPAAMIPAAIVPLAALPLLPNGKLDAAALPSPEAFAAAEGAA
ncbi:MAG TPA: amino acid adenylation domain-containing protein, partial [Thermoanaerobaculia bacterium]|nr:amino acid adenylation domain-containing protein [Thermoanaerobaculia bacterium]